jgi:hypothetical protein
MLKELFELVKGTAQDTVVNNPAIPNEQNNEVIAEATNTVASGLRNIVAGGGLQNLLSLLGRKGQQSGGLLSNPIVNMMIGHFAGKLMSKYGLGGAQANNVANGLIPEVIGNLINKTNDPNDSGFSLENLLNSITGGTSTEVLQQQGSGSGFSLPDILNNTGGGSQGGGLMDIVTKMAQGAQGQQQRNGGGGLMDLIKGFMR